jgi:hypothetical protein
MAWYEYEPEAKPLYQQQSTPNNDGDLLIPVGLALGPLLWIGAVVVMIGLALWLVL